MRYGTILLILTLIAAASLDLEASKEIRPQFTQDTIEIDGHLNEVGLGAGTSH